MDWGDMDNTSIWTFSDTFISAPLSLRVVTAVNPSCRPPAKGQGTCFKCRYFVTHNTKADIPAGKAQVSFPPHKLHPSTS